MGLLSKQLLKKETIDFRVRLEKERFFGQYPLSLIALKEFALTQLEKIKETLGIDVRNLVGFDIDDPRQLKQFIKDSDRLSKLDKFADRELNDDIISELLIKCERAKTSEDVKEFEDFKFYSDITNSIISAANDTLSKVDGFVNSINNFIESNMQYIEAAVLAYYIITLIIDLIRNTDFPSIYRLKYIQKLIRYTLAYIWNYAGEQFEKIKEWLKTVDDLMIAIAVAGTTYLINRKASQKAAQQLMLENACAETKAIYEEVEKQSLLNNQNAANNSNSGRFEFPPLSCPTPDDSSSLVPKEPYEHKLENFTCPVATPIDAITAPEYPDRLDIELSTKAKIVNNRKETMRPKVTKDQYVTTKTIVASIQNTPVYSPVDGYIESFNNKEIVLSDISDPEDDELMGSITLLNEKYRELNEVKSILKDYEIDCLYPVMLQHSLTGDPSINGVEYQYGVENEFIEIANDWYKKKGILASYEKNVQNITSEKNVRKHAENEELGKIKEELDKEENTVFKYLLQADDVGITIANQTIQLDWECEILEYYMENIVLKVNEETITEENADNYQYFLGFRTHINDFVRERYVVEGWIPEKISKKAIELLKELERGATNGKKFWKEGLTKYEERKKLSDVKYWLENTVKPDKDLEANEVTSLINRIYFLYEFYLDIEAFTTKYKNLKETSTRQQTNREGTYFEDFFTNLQVRYQEIPNEIKELEKKIEDLGTLSDYYTQTIDRVPYRIYPINPDESDCNSSYAIEVKSEYGLDDIRYWLKWCSYATLNGLVPLYWSTGLFAPAPILLPVIYIPIKPIKTKYGILLFGLTITGIYPFPLVLFANESSEYSSIIPIPPVEIIKKEIEDLKNKVSSTLEKFTNEALKSRLDNLTGEINELNIQIDSFEKQLSELKVNRPPKTKGNVVEYLDWVSIRKNLKVEKTKLEVERWKKEKSHQIINNAYTSGDSVKGSGDPSLIALEKTEETINNQLDNIVAQFDKIDLALIPFPTTLDPYTADFGFTLKNPKPTIKIADKLNENVNQPVLSKLIQPFQLNNEGFMSGPVKFNKTGYDSLLKLNKFLPVGGLISNDPFPKYEEISVLNIPFLKFLNKDFLPKGAQTYGIPGQLPIPIL